MNCNSLNHRQRLTVSSVVFLSHYFFFIVKDCKISLLMVKDFQFIVEMLQNSYDIVAEDIEGKIENTISKRPLQ